MGELVLGEHGSLWRNWRKLPFSWIALFLAAYVAATGIGRIFHDLWWLPIGSNVDKLGYEVGLIVGVLAMLPITGSLVVLGLVFGRRNIGAVFLAGTVIIMWLAPLPVGELALRYIITGHSLKCLPH